MTEKTPTNVIQAIAVVMAELPGIAKKKHPSESGKGLTYAYRGIEEITSEVQELFAKHCVVPVPRVISRSVEKIVVNGNDWSDTFLEVEWRIYGPGGLTDYVEAITAGQGRDNSDKGTNKAMTQAFKYLLLDLLCISDPADDTDGQTVETTPKAPTTTREAPKSSTPTAPTEPSDEWDAKQRNKVIAHLSRLTPPVRGDVPVAMHCSTILGLEEVMPLAKLNAEQGQRLAQMLGVS
jgi:hypothetical protein